MAKKQSSPTPDKGLSRRQLRILADMRRKIDAAQGSRKAVLDAQIRLTEEGIPPHLLNTTVLTGQKRVPTAPTDN